MESRGSFGIGDLWLALGVLLVFLRRSWRWVRVVAEVVRAGNAVRSWLSVLKKKEIPMSGAVGIQNIIEVIDLGMAVAYGAMKSYQDDKRFTYSDVLNFVDAGKYLLPALTDIGQVPAELADLQAEELAVLKDHILAKMPEVGERWMVVATESLRIGISIWTIMQLFRKQEV